MNISELLFQPKIENFNSLSIHWPFTVYSLSVQFTGIHWDSLLSLHWYFTVNSLIFFSESPVNPSEWIYSELTVFLQWILSEFFVSFWVVVSIHCFFTENSLSIQFAGIHGDEFTVIHWLFTGYSLDRAPTWKDLAFLLIYRYKFTVYSLLFHILFSVNSSEWIYSELTVFLQWILSEYNFYFLSCCIYSLLFTENSLSIQFAGIHWDEFTVIHWLFTGYSLVIHWTAPLHEKT